MIFCPSSVFNHRRCSRDALLSRSPASIALAVHRSLVVPLSLHLVALCFVAKMTFASHVFSLLGDSNVKRHMNPINCRDRPLMSNCQVLPCGKLSMLAETLKAVRTESNVILIACLTNFMTSTESTGSIVHRIDPVLREALSILNEFASLRPDLSLVVSPPMYRKSPLWYRDGQPEVMTKFSEIFKSRSGNILLSNSFATPELEGDGIHLTSYSGLEFVLHLFDSAQTVLSAQAMTVEETCVASTESTRLLEDRMVALEQDHRRLNSSVESKSAEDAELFDFQQNIRYEDFFTISGLAKQPSGLSPKEWQSKVKPEVQEVLKTLMGREYPIVVVLNSTSKRKDAPATYHVQLEKVEDSKEIRLKFGSFFLGSGGNKRPDALKHISIQNRVTPATSTRITILKTLGKRYVDSNPGSQFKVIGYEPRPVLKITPPEGVADRRVQTYNYIEAIRSLPTNFTKEEADDIVRRVSPRLHGKLRQLFFVISDDMLRRVSRSGSAGAAGGSAGGSAGSSGSGGKSGKGKDSRSTFKRGATSPANGGPEKVSK